MASAEEYARWIVANKDKKGTPEFETVAKAYELAKGRSVEEQPAPKAEPSALERGMERFKKNVSLTPPGMALQMAKAGMQAYDELAYDAGGKVTDVTGSPELGMAANVAVQAVPAVLGGGGARSAAKIAEQSGVPTVMEGAAKSLMHSALKPQSKDIVSGDAGRAIDTLLRADANISPAGAAKLRGLIGKLEGEVKTLISGASGQTVDKAYVASEVVKELQKFRNQVNPGADTKALLKSWDEFNNLVGPKIPVEQAQSLKQGTYKMLADKYAKMGTVENVPGTQAQMAMARGLRKGVEDAVPGVGALTKQEASLINALEMSERRAGIGGNRDIGGIAWLAENPAAATAMMADRSTAFKSWLANKLYQHRLALPDAAGAGVGIAAQHLSAP